ncbi:HAD-IC family P-type ATPase [Patescibacteria group bacterium]|nr:HAD-IC family P-type ATPase [Patescibacteria group bacterium]MBU1673584.1 HAD-IC family P-type ATPase [Patescibacteria group bacterium]MBU1963486.1 HAD-IC family P-type ATPase [Patescibacteria group bacterium]
MDKPWHKINLKIDPDQGLTDQEVKVAQEKYGTNTLTKAKGKSSIVLLLEQLKNPMIYLLIGSFMILAVLGDWLEAIIILIIIILNSVLGYVQEGKAQKAIAALSEALHIEANIIRGGNKKQISATELVPGDIILLQAGDKVPADLRLLQARELKIDESALTGESLPVEKTTGDLPEITPLADRKNMAYSSALVTGGTGIGIVTAIGDKTEIGHINQMVSDADILDTPLTKKIKKFSQLLLYITLISVAAILTLGFIAGYTFAQMALTVVSIAIAFIPASLPAVVTVTLAMGVVRLSKRNALIRKLPAVETLGSTTVICSDKTGTLTQNKMTVQEVYGEDKKEILTAGLLCNDATETSGDPTESALIIAAKKDGLDQKKFNNKFPRLNEIPFSSEKMYMATLHPGIIYIKGSIESILPRCKDIDENKIQAKAEELAEKGQRLLAFARLKVPEDKKNIDDKDLENLEFLGLQGMIDPPRPETAGAVKSCVQAGIKLKMITGDHLATAKTIGKQIIEAWAPKDLQLNAINGQDLEGLDGQQLINVVNNTQVFARVAPEQKLKLVKALQSTGNVVAMTGDGVNDAPALRQADIGVAMGITGTEVSKEAADMILTDDNFSSIVKAVEEGRRVYDNIMKIIAWVLPTNIAQAGVILGAIIIGSTVPILPLQILWVNIVTGGLLGAMLIHEPEEPGIMKHPPRKNTDSLLPKNLIWRVFIVGTLLILAVFFVFDKSLPGSGSLESARTAAVNAIVFGQMFYLLNCRSLKYPMRKLGYFSNKYIWIGIGIMVILQLLFTYAGFMQKIFETAPISLAQWGLTLGVSLFIFIVVEFIKWFERRKLKTKNN